MAPIKQLWARYHAPLLYLFFGGLTTIINYAVFYICNTPFNMYYQLANFIAWFVSVVFAFLTNKVWVFGSHYTTVAAFCREAISFFFYRGLSYFLDAGIMYVGVSLLAQNANLTKLADQVIIVVLNYFFSKFLIFKATKEIQEEEKKLWPKHYH